MDFTSWSTDSYGIVLNMSDLEIERVQERMYPGKWSEVGFLGVEDKLKDTCTNDSNFLQEKNISCEQIADKLEVIVEKAKQLYTDRIEAEAEAEDVAYNFNPLAIIDGKFKISGFALATNGYQKCPFSERVLCGKGRQAYEITNIENGSSISLSQLHIHMIRDHHFFEGKGTPYRLEPSAACDVLELQSGFDYSLELARTTRNIWQSWIFSSECMESHQAKLRTRCLACQVLDPSLTAYLMQDDVIDEKKIENSPTIVPKAFAEDATPPANTLNVNSLSANKVKYLHLLLKTPPTGRIRLAKDFNLEIPLFGAELKIKWPKGRILDAIEIYKQGQESKLELGPKDSLV
jgi:hypothetical protein